MGILAFLVGVFTSWNGGTFTSGGVDNGVLHAQGGTANNGRYAYGAGAFPASGAGNNYWVDVTFSQTAPTGSGQTNYVWDIAGGLPRLLQDGTKTYVYGDRLLYTVEGAGNGTPTWLFGDKLGSTATLVNAAGVVTGSYTYDVFGAVKTQTGAATEFSFTGEQNDPNGLEYLRARYYDPSTGRFLSRDPMGAAYRYAGNNPVNSSDPSGLWEEGQGGGYVCCDTAPEVGLPAGYLEGNGHTAPPGYFLGFGDDPNHPDVGNSASGANLGQALLYIVVSNQVAPIPAGAVQAHIMVIPGQTSAGYGEMPGGEISPVRILFWGEYTELLPHGPVELTALLVQQSWLSPIGIPREFVDTVGCEGSCRTEVGAYSIHYGHGGEGFYKAYAWVLCFDCTGPGAYNWSPTVAINKNSWREVPHP